MEVVIGFDSEQIHQISVVFWVWESEYSYWEVNRKQLFNGPYLWHGRRKKDSNRRQRYKEERGIWWFKMAETQGNELLMEMPQ